MQRCGLITGILVIFFVKFSGDTILRDSAAIIFKANLRVKMYESLYGGWKVISEMYCSFIIYYWTSNIYEFMGNLRVQKSEQYPKYMQNIQKYAKDLKQSTRCNI